MHELVVVWTLYPILNEIILTCSEQHFLIHSCFKYRIKTQSGILVSRVISLLPRYPLFRILLAWYKCNYFERVI